MTANEKDDRPPADVEAELLDSRLMEDYLAARVEQALADLEAARCSLAADSHNFTKAEIVLRAVHTVRTIEAELLAQREHIAALQGAPDERNPATPLQSAQAGEKFKARQAAKARQIVARFEGTETKSCPQCGTVLPVGTLLCFCSYRFPMTQTPRIASEDNKRTART
jgi:hypothetical protein